MLYFYDRELGIPSDLKLKKSNDIFFDAKTIILDNDIARKILRTIDNAEYYNNDYFIGRTDGTPVSKDFLSTGSKTLLNVLQYPDICFNIIECGANALELLFSFKKGIVYSEKYIVDFNMFSLSECDIYYDNIEFTDYQKFLERYEEVHVNAYSD